MVRRCIVAGCNSTAGLHSFPADLGIRRQWMHALGLGDREFPPGAKVCNLHFTRDRFSNVMEVEMGFSTQLVLKPDAVPNAVHASQRRIVPAMTREIGCQTEPVSTKHAFVQANMKPIRRSKAIQARMPNRSVSCDTGTLMEPFTECPGATSTTIKRKRCEVSTYDSSYHPDKSESATNSTRVYNEVPPKKVTKYIVYEDKLLELFKSCPVCTQSLDVSQTIIGTLLRVKQHCAYCEYSSDWSSQPMVNNIPAGNLQLSAAVLFSGSSFSQISKFLDAFKIQGISEPCFQEHKAKLLIPTTNWQCKIEQDEAIIDAIADGAKTLDGDIKAETLGEDIKAETLGEDITFETLGGDIKAETLGEDMRAETLGEDMRAETLDGDIKAETLGEDMRAETLGEDITFETLGGDIKAETLGEDITFETLGGDMKAETLDGDIES
ncbi:uncharacterized protein [Paramisgurnus dabryanus]|uniref:uncharacterized protein n=1 Tax=Paramisgurnus dabryanus TaxID=90735 RepID=UPI0031F3C100